MPGLHIPANTLTQVHRISLGHGKSPPWPIESSFEKIENPQQIFLSNRRSRAPRH
jgi:hypothetical protein